METMKRTGFKWNVEPEMVRTAIEKLGERFAKEGQVVVDRARFERLRQAAINWDRHTASRWDVYGESDLRIGDLDPLP